MFSSYLWQNQLGDFFIVFDITVTGADQKTPKKLLDAFRSKHFKESLICFLQKEWKSQKYAPLLRDKVLYVGVGSKCYKYMYKDNLEVSELLDLACDHQEADAKII